MRTATVLLFVLAGVREAAAVLPAIPHPPPLRADDSLLKTLAFETFEQLIDHDSPGVGSFSQRFWWNTTFWNGPGSPIILFNPGELPAEGYTGYLSDRTLCGQIAKAVGGAVVMVEHRNWGTSQPYLLQDTKNLQQHTLTNAVLDMVKFAREVELPFDPSGDSNAPQAPWVFVGGSYSGALAAWIDKLSPGTFWAYHASSAPVQAVYDYWSYFLPIQNGMPRNCSHDFSRIIEYVDEVLLSGTDAEVDTLKFQFGLSNLTHNDDVGAAIGYPIYDWQGIQLNSGYSNFFRMCDAIEGVNPGDSPVPGEDGIGLAKAFANYAAWFKELYLPGSCAGYGVAEWKDPLNVDCFDSYNASSPFFADQSPSNVGNRQWFWMTCNEPFFYWQGGAPIDRPTIFSRLASADYFQRQCDLWFPRQGCYTYASKKGRTAEDLNRMTDGWLLTNTTRLIWVNGEFDPWRTASVSSELRPGGPILSRPGAPVWVAPAARHCNDLLMRNAEVNSDLMEIVQGAIAQMKKWTDEFYDGKLGKRRATYPTREGLHLEVEPWDDE